MNANNIDAQKLLEAEQQLAKASHDLKEQQKIDSKFNFYKSLFKH